MTKRVLIIDDNVDAADLLADVLTILGNNEVSVAYSGEQGVSRAQVYRPDVILCDIGLPDIDGFEVAHRLRATPESSSALLVAVTGYMRPSEKHRATAAGFDAVVTKPADGVTLHKLIQTAGNPKS